VEVIDALFGEALAQLGGHMCGDEVARLGIVVEAVI
jgi:hypothetical protein